MKLFFFIFSFSFLFSFVDCRLIGDLNDDGSVDVLDIVIMVNRILEGYSFSDDELLIADLSGDGFVDILDVVQLVSVIMDSYQPPSVELTEVVADLDEDHQDLPAVIGTIEVTGEYDNISLSTDVDTSDASLELDGNNVVLTSLDPDFNGSIDYAVTASNDTDIDTVDEDLVINPIADVTFNVVDLFTYGRPLMDGILSTITLNGTEYTTTTGTLTMQLPAGDYDTWAENDSTGIVLGEQRADPIIIITPQGFVPIQDQNLAERHGHSTESIVTIGTDDLNLDLNKVVNWAYDEYVIAIQTMNRGGQGIAKFNTNTPNRYASGDTPTDETLANLLWVDSNFYQEVADLSEVSMSPVYQGFGDAPDPDPNGPTNLYATFDVEESPPGHHIENINPEGIIYSGITIFPIDIDKTSIAIETSQNYIFGSDGNLGGIMSYILYSDDDGNPHPKPFYVSMTKLAGYARPGFSFTTPGMSSDLENITSDQEIKVKDVFGIEHEVEYKITNNNN